MPARTALLARIRRAAGACLARRGYLVRRTGNDYLDPATVVNAAARAGLSLCDYLESRESDPRKRGRRDRIMARLAGLGVFAECAQVVEIGAGTGMYVDGVLRHATPSVYEVYETHPGWVKYLRGRYGRSRMPSFRCHPADGQTLSATLTGTCSLVHAHAVFVYIPALSTLSYLGEAARVLKAGGWLVFDFIDAGTFGIDTARDWLDSGWRFPVLLPRALVVDFARGHGLELADEFEEPYGPATDTYLVFRKAPA